MGIVEVHVWRFFSAGLARLISAEAPRAVREVSLKELNGRKIAIDASNFVYQFLVAIRSAGDNGGPSSMLMNAEGEVTSHLQGFFWRTIKMLENGIKPVYVFDGEAPEMKGGELEKRRAIKEKAEADHKEALKSGTVEEVERYDKRTVRMNHAHQEESKELLRLMGVPVVEAAGEAEAQCALLAAEGKVWAAASEDMDTLCFGAPVFLRRLTVSEAKKQPLLVYTLPEVIEDLKMDMNAFVDMCMLCGCDYLPKIKGVGPKTALKEMQKFGSMERVLDALRERARKKGQDDPVPDNFDFEQARKLFLEPKVAAAEDIRINWADPDEEGLLEFLVERKGFQENRVKSGVERMRKVRKGGFQRRMDSFFGGGSAKPATPKPKSAKPRSAKPTPESPKPVTPKSATPKSEAAAEEQNARESPGTPAGEKQEKEEEKEAEAHKEAPVAGAGEPAPAKPKASSWSQLLSMPSRKRKAPEADAGEKEKGSPSKVPRLS